MNATARLIQSNRVGLAAICLVLLIAPGLLAQGRFPEGRAIDRPTASIDKVLAQLDEARAGILQAATQTADPLIWSTAQRISLLVSSLGAIHEANDKGPFNRLPNQEQQVIRDTYLLIDLADGILGGTVSDPTLLERRLQDSGRIVATLDDSAPAVFELTPLSIAGAPADVPVTVEITGNKLFFTEKPPAIVVSGQMVGPVPGSNNDKLKFEVPRLLEFPDSGIQSGTLELILYQKRKRGMFRTEIVPVSFRLPIFLLPSRLASYVIKANVEVESQETKTRRSLNAKAESTGGPVSDEVCVNAHSGWDIVPGSARVGRVVDEEWAPDAVFADIWTVVSDTTNSFDQKVTTKRACLTVTARPSQPGNRAVASGWIEFREMKETTKRDSEELPGEILWGDGATVALPESTSKVVVDLTFFDGTTASFEGSGDHRWLNVAFDPDAKTVTLTPKNP